MLYLFFIQLLMFSANAKYSIFDQVIKDPVSFAQSFENVDPAQISRIITIINGLINDGQAKKKHILKELSDAIAATKVAKDEEAQALFVYETARGETKYALANLTITNNQLKKRQDEELAALNAKNLAQ